MVISHSLPHEQIQRQHPAKMPCESRGPGTWHPLSLSVVPSGWWAVGEEDCLFLSSLPRLLVQILGSAQMLPSLRQLPLLPILTVLLSALCSFPDSQTNTNRATLHYAKLRRARVLLSETGRQGAISGPGIRVYFHRSGSGGTVTNLGPLGVVSWGWPRGSNQIIFQEQALGGARSGLWTRHHVPRTQPCAGGASRARNSVGSRARHPHASPRLRVLVAAGWHLVVLRSSWPPRRLPSAVALEPRGPGV